MIMACFTAACWNDSSSHPFEYVLFDHGRGGILVPFQSSVFEDSKVLGFPEVIQLAWKDVVL